MNYKIEEGIKETVNQAVDSAIQAITYNITNVFQGLLYSLVLENEKQGGVGDINNLVRHIIRTSHYDGPENEEYPAWNERDPEAEAIIKRLETVLQAHGIEQAWNLGRNKNIKKDKK